MLLSKRCLVSLMHKLLNHHHKAICVAVFQQASDSAHPISTIIFSGSLSLAHDCPQSTYKSAGLCLSSSGPNTWNCPIGDSCRQEWRFRQHSPWEHWNRSSLSLQRGETTDGELLNELIKLIHFAGFQPNSNQINSFSGDFFSGFFQLPCSLNFFFRVLFFSFYWLETHYFFRVFFSASVWREAQLCQM